MVFVELSVEPFAYFNLRATRHLDKVEHHSGPSLRLLLHMYFENTLRY